MRRAQAMSLFGFRRAALLLAVAFVLPIAGCNDFQSALNPKSDQSVQITLLWWVMLAVGTIVLLGVTLLLAIAVTRGRKESADEELSTTQKRNFVVAAGVIVPAIVLFGLLVYSVSVGRSLSTEPAEFGAEIEVIGHRWWWEIYYLRTGRSQSVRTANEIYIPVGLPVKFYLKSMDVIHSFWVPNLHGKTDLIPGRTNTMWVRATEPGVFRGQCAEFCGLQHAKMGFVVVAKPEEEFYAWLDHQAQPAAEPTDPAHARGREVFLSKPCTMCHTIRGTVALATVAPDLTHFGSRLTIGAATLENTRGHLGGWIADPQRVKPGNRMPNMSLTPEELNSLTMYLESLK